MWSAKRILAAGAVLLLLTGCATQTEQQQATILSEVVADKAKSYETYEVQPNDIAKSGTLSLSVTYTQEQSLCAPENDLELNEVLVERRSMVKEGEPIATFSRSSSETAVAEAELNLSRAQEQQLQQKEQLQAALDAAEAAAGNELGNLQLELAQLNYDRAMYISQRQIDNLQTVLEQAQSKFETVTLTAPYDCVVNSVAYLYDRQKVDTATEIVEISRLSSMALVGETSTNNFQYGNEIEVEYGKKENRKKVTARVVSTSTLLGSMDQKVWVMLDEPVAEDELSKASARTEIIQIRDALTVPRSAIESDSGNPYVQILVDGVAHKRYIIRGINVGTAGDNHVVILSGLEAGQMVITN